MKVLLTGSSGFLGSGIIKLFTDCQIVTLARAHAVIVADLKVNQPDLPSTDLVIHAAGKAHVVPKTEAEKQEFFDVNVTGTQNLLKGIENAPQLPKYFVFISSVAVYGLEKGHLISEDAPLLAKDPYGRSKIAAEKIIEEWCFKNNVVCTILRLPLLAGPNPPGNLKSMISGIKKGYYFNIAGGKAQKSIVLAQDIAEIIPTVAKVGGIYNLTDGYHPNFSELSQLIAKQLGKSKPLNMPMWIAKLLAKIGDWLGSKAPVNSDKLNKIISDLTFDDSKAKGILGWKPTRILTGFKIV